MTDEENQKLVLNLRHAVVCMRRNAAELKSGEGYSFPQLQPQRDASAGTLEFWAGELERMIPTTQPEITRDPPPNAPVE
jgi:hypothetical protein